MVAAILDAGSDAMLAHLLGQGQLLQWLSQASETVECGPFHDAGNAAAGA